MTTTLRSNGICRRNSLPGRQVQVSHLVGFGLVIALALMFARPSAIADDERPDVSLPPGQAAVLSIGGRLYDNHWSVLRIAPPGGRHPLYPDDAKVADITTWRCVACHGWDYAGGDGHLGQERRGGRFVSLASLVGQKPEQIEQYLKYSNHQKMVARLSKKDLKALALFIGFGQHDLTSILNPDGKAKGDARQGEDIYEGACIRCHEADGKAPLYNENDGRSSLGWLARYQPARTLHKIRNGVTSADMLSLRFLELEDISDLVAYLQTLDPDER